VLGLKVKLDPGETVLLEILRHTWRDRKPAIVWGEGALLGARSLERRGLVEIVGTDVRLGGKREYRIRPTRAGELLLVDERAPFKALRAPRRVFGSYSSLTGLLQEARAASSRGAK